MHCDRDHGYAMQAGIHASLCSLSAENGQMAISIEVKKMKKLIHGKLYANAIAQIEAKVMEKEMLLLTILVKYQIVPLLNL